MTQVVSPRTGTRILEKGFDDRVEGRDYYFIVKGRSLITVGYISKVYITEEFYNAYDTGDGPVFELLERNYPYMDLGKIIE